MTTSAAEGVLARFAACLERGDAEGAAALFTPDAAYDEPPRFLFTGRAAIHGFVADFAARHREVRYEVVRTLSSPDGLLAAAEWRFSYTGTADGTRTAFAGASWIELREGLIARWRGFSARIEPAAGAGGA
jgi:ketosteroid isomerase-like protein